MAPNDDECILEFYCSLYPDRFIHEADDLTFGAHRKWVGGKEETNKSYWCESETDLVGSEEITSGIKEAITQIKPN